MHRAAPQADQKSSSHCLVGRCPGPCLVVPTQCVGHLNRVTHAGRREQSQQEKAHRGVDCHGSGGICPQRAHHGRVYVVGCCQKQLFQNCGPGQQQQDHDRRPLTPCFRMRLKHGSRLPIKSIVVGPLYSSKEVRRGTESAGGPGAICPRPSGMKERKDLDVITEMRYNLSSRMK